MVQKRLSATWGVCPKMPLFPGQINVLKQNYIDNTKNIIKDPCGIKGPVSEKYINSYENQLPESKIWI